MMKLRDKLFVRLPAVILIFVIAAGMILIPKNDAAAASDTPLMSDAADLLSDKEESRLLKKLEKISDEQDCDIAVYTIDDLAGQEIVDYADDIVDSVGLGESRSRGTATMLLYINAADSQDRNVWISTDKKASAYYSDNDIDTILDEVTPYLGRQEYAQGFETYADECRQVLISSGNDERGGSRGVSPFWIFGDLGIGAAIATLLGQHQKSKLKSRRKKTGAGTYADHGGIQFETNEDIFLDRRVERRMRERDEGRESSHEAGTTHTSSSGKEHGGGGRKF